MDVAVLGVDPLGSDLAVLGVDLAVLRVDRVVLGVNLAVQGIDLAHWDWLSLVCCVGILGHLGDNPGPKRQDKDQEPEEVVASPAVLARLPLLWAKGT